MLRPDEAPQLIGLRSNNVRPRKPSESDHGHARGRNGVGCTLGSFGRGNFSSAEPRSMMNLITQLPSPPLCTTGAVMAIFVFAVLHPRI
jgi:hypothetical protein